MIIRRRLWALPAALLLAGAGGGSAVQAEIPPENPLAGYTGSAASSGLRVGYVPKGVLPIASPVDLGAPDTLATINSGPLTFARASVADPGDLLANPDALLALIDPNYPKGTIPPYPVRVSATSGSGPSKAENSAGPGLNARVQALPSGSRAEASAPAADGGAVAKVSSSTSISETIADASGITIRTRTAASDIDVLGVLTIDSVVTELTAQATAQGTKVAGDTVVTGAKIAGRPVVIDGKGIRGPVGGLKDVLAKAGLKVTVAGPVAMGGQRSGTLSSAGLRIDLDFSDETVPLLSDVLDDLPSVPGLPVPGAPTFDDVVALARANQISSIQFAGGSVSLAARPAPPALAPPTILEPFQPATGPLATVPLSPGAAPAPFVPLEIVAALPPAAAPAQEQTDAAPLLALPVGDVSLGRGLGILALLGLLLQPLLGWRLARFAGVLLGGGDDVECARAIR